MPSITEINNHIILVAMAIGALLPIFLICFYFALRRELILLDLRNQTSKAKEAKNSVKYSFELGLETFIISEKLTNYQSLNLDHKLLEQKTAKRKLAKIAKHYRRRYKYFSYLIIKLT